MGNNRTGFATPTFIGPPASKPTFMQRFTSPFRTGKNLGRTALSKTGTGIANLLRTRVPVSGVPVNFPVLGGLSFPSIPTATVGSIAGTGVVAASPLIAAVVADQAAEAARRRGEFIIEGEKFDPETGKVIDEGTIGELGFLEQELAGSEDLPTDRPVTARS